VVIAMTAGWIVAWSVIGVIGAVLLWLVVVAVLVVLVEDRHPHSPTQSGPPEAEQLPAGEDAKRPGALVP
jgi:hypothetical protein